VVSLVRDNDFWLGVTVEAKSPGATEAVARETAAAVAKGVLAGL